MSDKSAVRCETQECKDAIEKYGANYHSVYDKGDYQWCDRCGAVQRNGVWTKTCKVCSKQVDRLYGLFVPHKCVDCQAAERKKQEASNNRCGMCHQLYMDCCC